VLLTTDSDLAGAVLHAKSSGLKVFCILGCRYSELQTHPVLGVSFFTTHRNENSFVRF
jgi:hypothetical protein